MVGSRRLNRRRCFCGRTCNFLAEMGALCRRSRISRRVWMSKSATWGRSLTRNLAVEEVQAETDGSAGWEDCVSRGPSLQCRSCFRCKVCGVKLSLDGLPAIEQTATVEGHSRRLVRFEVPIREPGLYQGYVEVTAGDDLPFDDRRWLAFEARRRDRILLVDGEPGPSVFGNETYFLEMALRLGLPGQDPNASISPYQPERLAWNGQSGSLADLAQFRVVALCNVPDLSPADAGALEAYVRSGGNLVIFTGDLVKAGVYSLLQEAKVMPGRLDGPAADGPYRLAGWEKDHPIFSLFEDPLHGDLRTLRFRRIARIVPDAAARVLVTARGGSPLLVERSHGAGKCLLLAIPADNAWGEWAIGRLYVPLVHQLVGYASNRLPELGHVKYAAAGQGPTEAPGVAIENGRALVQNVEPAESEIERTSVATLREVYRLPEARKGQPQQARASIAAGREQPDELWRPIAWGLLIVLAVETFVANRTLHA